MSRQQSASSPSSSSLLLLVSAVVSSFLLGVAATVAMTTAASAKDKSQPSRTTPDDSARSGTATSRSVKNLPQSSSNATNNNVNKNNNNNNTRRQQTTDLLDSPQLDLRLIRKAEAVIRLRSGNLTVVIERSTNSWNYSACLRTAEALVSKWRKEEKNENKQTSAFASRQLVPCRDTTHSSSSHIFGIIHQYAIGNSQRLDCRPCRMSGRQWNG